MADGCDQRQAAVSAWAKRCYFSGRAVMETALRPHALGATQWYVLHQLKTQGPTMQRALLRHLAVERATLSVIVKSLVGKGLVEQVADRKDQRAKLLKLTTVGDRFWATLPDLGFIRKVAFADIDQAELDAAVRVLRLATERLERLIQQELDG